MCRSPAGRRWLAVFAFTALCGIAANAAAADLAADLAVDPGANPVETSVFDQLFGAAPASERAGEAADGLALPGLYADGQRLAEALPLQDLGPGAGACVAISPLLDALELDYRVQATGDVTVTLLQPVRQIGIPATALKPSPSGPCLPLAAVGAHLPLTLAHNRITQRMALMAQAPLPVLMRLDRAARQARLHPTIERPAFALQARPLVIARLWSAEVAFALRHDDGSDAAATLAASGALFGMAARGSLGLATSGATRPGLTLTEARETSDLLGPLHARSIAIGDIGAPAQPPIADTLSGRGLVISSRPPWRADLIDEIDLSGPLPTGWEAELWHEHRLVAATRQADAAGLWRFGNLPVRLGENRWIVRLYGPHGETTEQAFTRTVGSEMNAENEVDYAFGFIDGGRPLIGPGDARTTSGGASFASMGWGLAPAVTARLDVRAPLAGKPALAMGLHGSLAGSLWAMTMARDGQAGWGGALRLARRFGSQDLVIDMARHGRDAGPAQPPAVREFADLAAINGQGRLAMGRLSLPWQVRLQSATLRSGGDQQTVALRLALPLPRWQANAALGLVRQGAAGWQGNAALGFAADIDRWRLRAGADATLTDRWRAAGATLSAGRSSARGSVNLDLSWAARTGQLGGGISLNRRLGAFGVTAAVGRHAEAWRIGLGLTMGLWHGSNGWHVAPAGLARSGAVLVDMFVDDDGDGARSPGETGVADAGFVIGNAVRSERTDAGGTVLIGGLPAGPSVDVETQLGSLTDFTLRPLRPGDRLQLRPGEIRPLAVPLQRTGSIEVRVLLAAGDERTPRSGVSVMLFDAQNQQIAARASDFDGYVLFDALPLGQFRVEAAGQAGPETRLTRSEPDVRTTLLLPASI